MGADHVEGASGRGKTLVALALAVAAISCSAPGNDARRSALGDDAITVASFDFPGSVVLAEVYAQALEAGGFRVERALSLGPREFVAPALAAGLVELVPEYAGTAAEFVSLQRAEPSDDPARAHDELVDVLEASGSRVTALAGALAQDANTFVVTAATAAEHGLTTLSDLRLVAGDLTFGGPPECATRPRCLAGLTEVYGLRFGAVTVLDTGGPLTRQALRSDVVDVALLFTTDPILVTDELVELVDDRRLQPAENVTPLVRTEVIETWGTEVVGLMDNVSRRMTTANLRQFNASLSRSGATPAEVAAQWLEREGLA